MVMIVMRRYGRPSHIRAIANGENGGEGATINNEEKII